MQTLLAMGTLLFAFPAAAEEARPNGTSQLEGSNTDEDFDSVESTAPELEPEPGDSPEVEAGQHETHPEEDAAEGSTSHAVEGGAEVHASGTAEGNLAVAPASGTARPDDAAPVADDAAPVADDTPVEGEWKSSIHGYFRAPMALGLSQRADPQDPTGERYPQISYGPNRTVDANYFSFAYTRLQEQDWVELAFSFEKEHVQATVGWMGYWFQTAGFRNPDAVWLPGLAYLTIDTDFDLGDLRPNIALSGGTWWPKFGYFEKYDTFTLAQYRILGEQLKLTVPFSDALSATLVQGFGTARDGQFNYVAPPFYQTRVGLNLIHYGHLQFNIEDLLEVGVHYNGQFTRDPNFLERGSGEKSYGDAREAYLRGVGGEVRLSVPVVGEFWASPSFYQIKNGWALGQGGVEVVHGLSPQGLATNYLGWSGSPENSTGSGQLFNVGFQYENKLSNVLGEPTGGDDEVTVSVFGLLVDAMLDRPEGSVIRQNKISQFKWGADVEYNPWKWLGLMARWDQVNYDINNPGYIFSSITSRLSLHSNYMSGERIYLQYSRYQYGTFMTIAGQWPWGTPLVAGSDTIQGGVYTGSKPDMDVIKLQADVRF